MVTDDNAVAHCAADETTSGLLMMTLFQAIFFAVAIGAYGLLALALIWRVLRGVLPPIRRASVKQESIAHPKEYLFARRQQYRRGGIVLLLPVVLATSITALCRQESSNSAEMLE